MDHGKIEAVSNWEAPKNVVEIQSFMGLAGYYRRFVKDFSKIARPITTLMRKETRFCRDKSCETAFQTLKERLTTTLNLALPKGSENFELNDEMTKMGIHMIRKGDAISDLTIEPKLYEISKEGT
ncbi:putative mitochondrial protein AtMg00860 [Silene latifolia]|uniref:putative mitochondrial protein AtMg00860 n=1 Tax=Silene latifolia TaxID=37657 RepID=UPI003D76EBC4